jgi:hypothetical protein
MAVKQSTLPLGDEFLTVNQILSERHYLGSINRGECYRDEFGLMVFANPSSRRLPQERWFELVRWYLYGQKNGGSRQWRRAARWLRQSHPEITTIVSYSDPSRGHTGALYRACNWLWAPTWLRLRPPPTGNGKWTMAGETESVKDRWVFCLRSDPEREALLALQDGALRKQYPWAEYRERTGGDFKRMNQR